MTRFLPTLKSSTWILILGLFVGLSVLLWPEFAHASGEETSMLANILYSVVLNLTGWFLFVGGMLLDYGINTFVINFGTVFNSEGVGEAVNQLWAMVRDLFNILFIFGLVYIGFKMILNSDDSQTKKTLISLIIAALLMNFSLFITKFVVDFSNILASEVALAGFENTTALGSDTSRISVGNTFFDLMGVSSFIDPNRELTEGKVEPWSFIFGIGIINIIGAFAFGVGGIMLIIRFIALSVYMVLSPFMFLGWIFPGFQAMSSKYWSGFFKQAFYAPVYIVMVFFSATILRNFFGKGVGSAQNADGGLQQGANTFGSVTGDVTAVADNFAGGLGPFILSAGFLIAAVQVAGKLSSDGSGIMSKVTNGVNSRVRGAIRRPLRGAGQISGRMAASGTAYGMRNTIGAGANAYANSKFGKDRAATSIRGKLALDAAQGVAKSSFDARRVSKVGKKLGIGEGQKGGFAKDMKDKAKKADEFAKAIAVDFDEKDPKNQPAIAAKVVELRHGKKAEKENLAKAMVSKSEEYEDRIEVLEKEVTAAGSKATDEQKIELEQTKAAYAAANQAFDTQISELETMIDPIQKVKETDNEFNSRIKKAENKLRVAALGQLKFKNELAYVKRLQSSEKFFKNFAAAAGGTGAGVGGAAGAMIGGGLITGGIAGVGAVSAMVGNAQSAKAGHKAITKRIGEDGTKAVNSAAQAQALKVLAGELKGDEEPKEDTKSEDS